MTFIFSCKTSLRIPNGKYSCVAKREEMRKEVERRERNERAREINQIERERNEIVCEIERNN